MSVVSFEGVTKYFRLGHRSTGIKDIFVALMSKNKRPPRMYDHYVLRDVSFTVAKGETFGIIGPNGSGKSTILKLAAGIINPNKGHVKIKGRVSSLLEVGAGFQPDLTGRENIFLYGTILGLTKKTIKSQIEDIIDFSGVDPKFIDEPVKYYSSGMYMRLAFSVAVNVVPDVLIADEVLSVGDEQFQQKCISKIDEMRKQGVTVLYVSHDLATVQKLCSNVLYLRPGGLATISSATTQILKYREDNSENDITI